MTQDKSAELRELLAKGVRESDSGWYISSYTDDGLSVISDGLQQGMYRILAERPQAELIVAAVNALPALLDRIEALEKGLEPFAIAARAVEQNDPDYPEHGAALRASFDWFVRLPDSDGVRAGYRGSVTRADLQRARILLSRSEGNG